MCCGVSSVGQAVGSGLWAMHSACSTEMQTYVQEATLHMLLDIIKLPGLQTYLLLPLCISGNTCMLDTV